MKNYFILAFAFIILLGGCARNISTDQYSETEIGSVKQTYKGVVIASRPVTVQGGDSLGDNTIGLVGGGAAGGILGSQIGKGKGSVVGMVLGAAAGALGGAMAEKALKTQDGIEYTVELQSGRVMSIVQGPQPALAVGQSVLVLVGSKGRPRIIADQLAQQQQFSQQQQGYYEAYPAAPRQVPRPKSSSNRKVSRTLSSSSSVYYQALKRSVDDIDYQNRDRYGRDQGL